MAEKAYKVLVVDDDPSLIEIVDIILTTNGYLAITAFSGEEGIQKAVVEDPDIIFMDIGMPIMDGFEAFSRIRQEGPRPRVPVVALTAFAMKGDEENILEYGFDGYLSKPFLPEVMIQEIKKFLAD